MQTMSYRTIIELVLLTCFILILWRGCNNHQQSGKTVSDLCHYIDSLKAVNTQKDARIAHFEQVVTKADSVDTVDKAEHLKKPVKERVADVKKEAPGIYITSDSTFTAGVELADTVKFLRISLNTCQVKLAAKDSIIGLQQEKYETLNAGLAKAVDTVAGLEKQVNMADKKVKRLVFWLKAVGTVAVVSTVVAVVR